MDGGSSSRSSARPSRATCARTASAGEGGGIYGEAATTGRSARQLDGQRQHAPTSGNGRAGHLRANARSLVLAEHHARRQHGVASGGGGVYQAGLRHRDVHDSIVADNAGGSVRRRGTVAAALAPQPRRPTAAARHRPGNLQAIAACSARSPTTAARPTRARSRATSPALEAAGRELHGDGPARHRPPAGRRVRHRRLRVRRTHAYRHDDRDQQRRRRGRRRRTSACASGTRPAPTSPAARSPAPRAARRTRWRPGASTSRPTARPVHAHDRRRVLGGRRGQRWARTRPPPARSPPTTGRRVAGR